MKIAVSRPTNGMGIDGDEHLLDESGSPLRFETVQEALRFLAGRNFTITDLLGFDFHFEEEPKETLCTLAVRGV
jgi:hypothetical protein